MSESGDNRSRSEHAERWGDELAAYALDALAPDERAAFEAHLQGCEACRERLRWLAPAVDVLPATVPQADPPATLKASLMEVVDREAVPAPAAAAEPRPGRSTGRRFRDRFGISLRPALAGFAVFLLLAAGLTGYLLHDDGSGGDAARDYVAKAEGPDSSASGMLHVDGDSGSLHVSNLPAARPGEVYQAWIQDTGAAGGAIHPSSVFVVSEGGVGDVAIPHGLENARRVMVTREPKGGSEAPTESPILTAETS